MREIVILTVHGGKQTKLLDIIFVVSSEIRGGESGGDYRSPYHFLLSDLLCSLWYAAVFSPEFESLIYRNQIVDIGPMPPSFFRVFC